jgi:hypothetical protein
MQAFSLTVGALEVDDSVVDVLELPPAGVVAEVLELELPPLLPQAASNNAATATPATAALVRTARKMIIPSVSDFAVVRHPATVVTGEWRARGNWWR